MTRLLLVLASGLILAAPADVVVDGVHDDWARVRPVFEAGRSESAVIRQVRVSADSANVFFLFEFAKDSYALPGTVTLLADSDGQAATGRTVDGLAGVDVAIDLFGGPLAVTVYDNEAGHPVASGPYDLELTKAPNFAARDVEVGWLRSGAVGPRTDLFGGRTLHAKVVARDPASRIVQEGEFRAPLPVPGPSSRAAQPRDPLARSASTDFRVVQWNVSNRFWRQNPEPYRRILRALQPDLVLFDEVEDKTDEAWIRTFLGSVGPPDAAWQVTLARTGAWERSLVASHFPLTTAFDRVSHTAETITRLGPVLEPFLPKTSPPPRKTLEDGVTASAAFITIRSKTLLATALDLACCQLGEVREAEAVAIGERVHAALRSRRVDAVITGGDYNLLHSRRPLDLLAGNFDPAGGGLAVESAVSLNGWSDASYTPRRNAPFPRSKLDYLLYSPSRLRLQHAFVFHSKALSRQWQQHHGIEPADSDVTDHSAIVADFSWKE